MKKSTARAANDDMHRPVILYDVPDGPQDRDYQCGHYHDCLSRVSLVKKAHGFTCVGCPSNSNAIIKEEEHTEKGMLISVPAALHPGNGAAGQHHPRFRDRRGLFQEPRGLGRQTGRRHSTGDAHRERRRQDTGSMQGRGESSPRRKREWRPYRPWSFRKALPSRS